MKVKVLLLVYLLLFFCKENKPVYSYISPSTGMKFQKIPAREFMMGCSTGDASCDNTEKPLHKVKITQPFYIGIYEVSQEEYQKIMGKNPSGFGRFQECIFWNVICTEAREQNLPVEGVSWQDAVKFANELSKRDGLEPVYDINYQRIEGKKGYRLPTEAEWEYAARAGSTTKYYFGDDADKLGDYAWYSNNSDKKTHPVGQKKPNSFGLYDIHGNVWEMCEDWFDNSYYKQFENKAAVDPKGPEEGSYRVDRGGSWNDFQRDVSVSNRGYWLPELRYDDIGFRLFLSSP